MNKQYVHHLNDGYGVDGLMFYAEHNGRHPSCSRVELVASEIQLFEYLNNIGSLHVEHFVNSKMRVQLFKVGLPDSNYPLFIEVRQATKQVNIEFNPAKGFFEVPSTIGTCEAGEPLTLNDVQDSLEGTEVEDKSIIKSYNINILYDITQKTQVDTIVSKLKTFKFDEKKEEVCKLNLVVSYGGSLDLQTFNIDPPQLDLTLNYGKDFQEKHDYLVFKLKDPKTNKGLVLLHGAPGCGKTYYIRHLVKILSKDRKVIYIPPDLAHEIASPHFLAFLLDNPGSILVIEDAENIIRSRKNGQNQAVANLLNTTDGLLADCLKVQIICTFNCDYNDVDDALKRKGRLIVEHKFDKLSKEQAQLVANSLGLELTVEKEMTLAEIYNCRDLDFKQEQKTKIGFNI